MCVCACVLICEKWKRVCVCVCVCVHGYLCMYECVCVSSLAFGSVWRPEDLSRPTRQLTKPHLCQQKTQSVYLCVCVVSLTDNVCVHKCVTQRLLGGWEYYRVCSCTGLHIRGRKLQPDRRLLSLQSQPSENNGWTASAPTTLSPLSGWNDVNFPPAKLWATVALICRVSGAEYYHIAPLARARHD